MTGHGRLSAALSDLAALVHSGADLEHTTKSVVAVARDNLACEYAGLTVRRRDGGPQSLAATDRIVRASDQLQSDLGEGPAVDAVWDQQDFEVRDITPEDISFAHVFAHQAAITLDNARRLDQLRVAIDERTLIGQAQGVRMERFGLTPDQVFGVLRRYSQDNHIKVSVIARTLVETGQPPEVETTPTTAKE